MLVDRRSGCVKRSSRILEDIPVTFNVVAVQHSPGTRIAHRPRTKCLHSQISSRALQYETVLRSLQYFSSRPVPGRGLIIDDPERRSSSSNPLFVLHQFRPKGCFDLTRLASDPWNISAAVFSGIFNVTDRQMLGRLWRNWTQASSRSQKDERITRPVRNRQHIAGTISRDVVLLSPNSWPKLAPEWGSSTWSIPQTRLSSYRLSNAASS